MRTHLVRRLGPVLALAVAVLAPVPVAAQPVVVRLGLVSQWVVNQQGQTTESLGAALERGLVDGVAVSWQRGRIPRSALVPKPIRALPAPEAASLGGRGECDVTAVRPPAGPAVWSEVDVLPRTGRPDDVCVLEVGGELNTIHQVLARLYVAPPGAALEELPLVRRSLFSRPGVPVIRVQFGKPVAVPAGVSFTGRPGVDFLVARSLIETIENAAVTPNGQADASPFQAGEWREADRVYIRLPVSTLRAGATPIALVWKDRVFFEQPDRGRIFDP
jgi:hypothetical protein